jgi:alkylation response protein AidB-like acyl-CoA dehydrogenase
MIVTTADPEYGLDFVAPIREFLDRRLAPESHRRLLAEGGWDPRFMAELVELGWSDLTRPEARDGLGVGLPAIRGLAELLGERLVPGPLAEQLVLQALLDVPSGSLLAFADPAITEDWAADAGSLDLTGTTLDGTVELVRFGAQADHLVVVARTGRNGTAVVLLPADDPSVVLTELRSADPTSHYARLTVNRHAITDDEVLVAGDDAEPLLARVRTWLRLFASCELAGIARRMLADTVSYAGQREQFDRKIGSFQAVKHIIAGMAQASISLEALCEATVDDVAGDDTDIELAGWTVKAYAARTARAVCEDALQVHGGIGFTTEYDLHWYLRRALALQTWYGDEHELTNLIGARRLSGRGAA